MAIDVRPHKKIISVGAYIDEVWGPGEEQWELITQQSNSCE